MSHTVLLNGIKLFFKPNLLPSPLYPLKTTQILWKTYKKVWKAQPTQREVMRANINHKMMRRKLHIDWFALNSGAWPPPQRRRARNQSKYMLVLQDAEAPNDWQGSLPNFSQMVFRYVRCSLNPL